MKYLNIYSGLGDSIYIRPFVKKIAEVDKKTYIKTPWVSLYQDIPNLRFVHPGRDYRTQQKNIRRIENDTVWDEDAHLPTHRETDIVRIGYTGEELSKHANIMRALQARCVEYVPSSYDLDLPPSKKEFRDSLMAKLRVQPGQKLAVIRPVTLRKEWEAPARAPLPEYIRYCTELLMNLGYHVITVADTDGKHEWMVEPTPFAHQHFIRGELIIDELMELARIADLMVGGIGWIVPMTIAARTPTFWIHGGQGEYNQISKLTDPDMDLSNVWYTVPENFCRCTIRNHECNKVIKTLEEDFHKCLYGIHKRPVRREQNLGTIDNPGATLDTSGHRVLPG